MVSLLTLLVIILIIFLLFFIKAKREEKKWRMIMYQPDTERPYQRGAGNSINEYRYQMFDQFIRNTWNRNLLSWENLDAYPIERDFYAPHHIMIYHTDGTKHDEIIKVKTATDPSGISEYGTIFSFSVAGMEQPKAPSPKPEPTPEPKKPIEEFAKEWLEAHRKWIDSSLSEGYLIIKYGDGENECPEEMKDALFNAINDLDLYQLQFESDGSIGVYPMPDI